MNILLKKLINPQDKMFLNSLIKSNLKYADIVNVIWDYIFDNREHTLFYCFGWNGGTIHQIIDEVFKRQKEGKTI